MENSGPGFITLLFGLDNTGKIGVRNNLQYLLVEKWMTKCGQLLRIVLFIHTS